jgi:hypothetical protein
MKRAVIVPDAPALVPQLGGSASAPLEQVRVACLRAMETSTGRWLAVGTGDVRRTCASGEASVGEYGRDLDRHPSGNRTNTPPALLVASWLYDAAGLPASPVELLDPHCDAADCRELAAGIAPDVDNLLVLGSGTFTWEPGDGTDHAEHALDRVVQKALANGDRAQLESLEPDTCRDAHVQGWGPWQALAAVSTGRDIRAELHYSDAPFGVRYHVATWDLG